MTKKQTYSYFPGCSLATSAHENNESLIEFLKVFDVELVELEDWNCCGSSSAHSLDAELAFGLACRNLSLAPANRPLLIACPGCFLRLKGTQHELEEDEASQAAFVETWDRPFNPDLRIIHIFELLQEISKRKEFKEKIIPLNGLRIAPYYGCMLAHPPSLRGQYHFSGILENFIQDIGGVSVPWSFAAKCCGTFLTVARPDVATTMVEKIIHGAREANADCVVTACAMCHLNLEVRSPKTDKIPIFHFSEMLAMSVGLPISKSWFARHLIDPKPMLREKGFI